ncbi:MAG: ABC transporter substrate-binding protein [Candidatus Methanomethylicaceae archaeon]
MLRKVAQERQKISRRDFIRSVVGGATILGLSGFVGRAQVRPLKVTTYGGIFKSVMEEVLIKPFMEDTGIPVEITPFEPEEAIVALKRAVDAGEAPVDVPITAVRTVIQGIPLGIWKLYSPRALDNLKYISPHLVTMTEDGKVAGVGALSWYLNLVYNTAVVKEELDSWTVFWDSKYKNMCGVNRNPAPSYLLDITAVTYFGGQEILKTKEGILKVLNKLAEIKPQVKLWWESEAEFEGPLLEGEVPIGQLYNDVTLVMAEEGKPVKSVFPKEGGVLDHGEWPILKTTPMFGEALLFIDYSCRPDVQNRIAEKLYTAPALKKEYVELPPGLEEKINGPGPDAAIKPDPYLYIGETQEFIRENWERILFG